MADSAVITANVSSGTPLSSSVTSGATVSTSVVQGTSVTGNVTTGGVGPTGATGAAGANGADGVGVPTGGTTGQALTKSSNTNYATTWSTVGDMLKSTYDAANIAEQLVGTSATQTLTNKTLTSPKVGTAILDTNGNELIKLTATGSAVNEITLANGAAGFAPTVSATGDDTDITLWLRGKGTGSIVMADGSSQKAIEAATIGTAVNNILVLGRATGIAPSVGAAGSDTNINLELTPKGSGRVTAGGVNVPTISSTDTLTNKTISGSSNTLSNIGVSSLSATGTPDNTTYLRGDGTWSTPSSSSGITRSIVTTSGNVTAGSTASTDYVYLVAGAHTVTLPTAVSNTNRYTIKNNHSANITVATTSSQTIDGTTTITIAPEDSVDLISNNSNWYII